MPGDPKLTKESFRAELQRLSYPAARWIVAIPRHLGVESGRKNSCVRVKVE